jgi:hypothetical protein
MRDEDGNLRWSVILAGVIIASVTGTTGWLVAQASTLSAVEARQSIILQRLDRIESKLDYMSNEGYSWQQHP